VTSTFAGRVERGRHRPGRPGRVPVGTFVQVLYRGLFLSWRQPGRHLRLVEPRTVAVRTRVPAHAV
jgi:hypothetical protein